MGTVIKERYCVKCGTPKSKLNRPPFVYSFDSEPWPIICQPCRTMGINKQIEDFQNSNADTSNTYNPVCPHCGHKHQDSWEWQGDDSEVDCENCENEFHYERIVTVEYTTTKIT